MSNVEYHSVEYGINEKGEVTPYCKCSWHTTGFRFMREAEAAWVMHLYTTAFQTRVKANAGHRD